MQVNFFESGVEDAPDLNLHMCFCGNSGTGKTEVVRILSRILYETGVLPETKLTETDSQGLISKYVGDTASKTLAKTHILSKKSRNLH